MLQPIEAATRARSVLRQTLVGRRRPEALLGAPWSRPAAYRSVDSALNNGKHFNFEGRMNFSVCINQLTSFVFECMGDERS